MKHCHSSLIGGYYRAALFLLLSSVSYAQLQTYTFTTAGASGSIGPTSSQVANTYSNTNLSQVTSSNGIQSWTIPVSGLYLIDAYGASGGSIGSPYNQAGGLGSRIQGLFNLSAGTVLKILVGQKAGTGCGASGGGGASFITSSNGLLIVAGGGGGATIDNFGAHSATVNTGTHDNPNGPIPGGQNGNGGSACSGIGAGTATNNAGGGGGYFSNGATSTASLSAGGGQSFLNGGIGGAGLYPGGFGGGGGVAACGGGGGGGGGGYSGGAGGQQANFCQSGLARTGGGGGGSYNSALSQTNTLFGNTGNGKVIIKQVCNVFVYASAGYGAVTQSLAPVICAGNSIALVGNAVSNFSWSTGATTPSIVVTPSINTVYHLTAKGSQSCIATTAISVTVSQGPPSTSLSVSNQSICLGDSTKLHASGALTYSFSNGVVDNAWFYPGSTITYSVTGYNGCGSNTVHKTVTVTPIPISAVANPSQVCAQTTSTIQPSGAASYTLLPYGTHMPPFVAIPATATTYTIIGKSGVCKGSGTVNISTMQNPTLSISGSGSVTCSGQSVTLSVSGADTYTWANAGLTGTLVQVTPTAPTAYNIYGSNSIGCTGSAQYLVIAYPKPKFRAIATPTRVCRGSVTTLSVTGTNAYTWFNGVQGNTTTLSPQSNTVLTVVGTESVHGCSRTASVTLTVYQETIAVSSNTEICRGDVVALKASGANSYTWSTGSHASGVMLIPLTTSLISLDATKHVGTQKCATSNSILVGVHEVDLVAVPNKTMLCKNQTLSVTVQGADTYTWQNGSHGTVVVQKTNNIGPITMSVSGTDLFGCKASTLVSVQVTQCTDVPEQQLQLISVYPNPCSGEFSVYSPEPVQIDIYLPSGLFVQSIPASAFVENYVSMEGFARGVYFLTYRISSETRFVKLLVQ